MRRGARRGGHDHEQDGAEHLLRQDPGPAPDVGEDEAHLAPRHHADAYDQPAESLPGRGPTREMRQ